LHESCAMWYLRICESSSLWWHSIAYCTYIIPQSSKLYDVLNLCVIWLCYRIVVLTLRHNLWAVLILILTLTTTLMLTLTLFFWWVSSIATSWLLFYNIALNCVKIPISVRMTWTLMFEETLNTMQCVEVFTPDISQHWFISWISTSCHLTQVCKKSVELFCILLLQECTWAPSLFCMSLINVVICDCGVIGVRPPCSALEHHDMFIVVVCPRFD